MNIAIITGASSGMGREFARQLAASLTKTDEIWLLARKRNALEELAYELTSDRHKHMIKIRTIAIDITDERKLARFAEVLMIRNAGISVLVNCAGMGIYGAFEAQSRDEITETVRLNVLALTQMTKFCLPYMKKAAASFSSHPAPRFFHSPVSQYMRPLKPMYIPSGKRCEKN